MADVAFYSLVEMASGFSPNLTAFLALRALYGIAMGGEWGIGAALALESVPTSARGAISGLLQCGYPCGYLLASVVFGALFPVIGWRGMFILGGAPALLVLYIRRNVPESPAWHAHAFTARAMAQTVRQHWRRFAYCIVMVAVFSFGTHGTQDIYPTMLRVQRGLSPRDVSVIATLYTIGGMFGTLFFGAFSERIGRSRTIILAMIGALLTIPLWAFATNLVALTIGAIVIQFLIQGAAGVLPAHLNELSPDEVRGTFPGLSYQLGTLFPAANATLQIGIAEYFNNNYALALALVAGVVTVLLPVIVGFGYEAKGVSFGGAETQTAPEQRSGAV
jgi:SHS family lactate transporter-like MFS transporter